MIKKIDKLILKSFVGPFVMTFFIALFVLIMQFLWKYIDDIVGKGLELNVILELIFYLSTSLFPMALPIAVLISSVMVMGNLAERYELASLKSAGVPLLRIMAPLIVTVILISISSYFCSNNLVPYSNLKFKSRLYDIRKQKPSLSIEQGVFNDDIKGYVIRVDEKSEDGKDLKNVLVYDHSSNRGNDKLVSAKTGQMYYSTDKKYLIMNLKEGNLYEEVHETSKKKESSYPFLRTSYESYETYFDMAQFDLKQTDEDLFKNHQTMLTSSQLLEALDSIQIKRVSRLNKLESRARPYFYYKRKIKDKKPEDAEGLPKNEKDTIVKDDARPANRPPKTVINFDSIEVDLDSLPTEFIELFPKEKQHALYDKAISTARSMQGYTSMTVSDLDKNQKTLAYHWNEYYKKFVMAFACFLFLFIGAPMGAIIRKGGFGWPLLVAIIFFVTFIVLNLTGENLSKKLVLSPIIGMFLPCIVLFPIGAFLTYKAMSDSKALDLGYYLGFFKKIIALFKGKQNN